MLSEGKQEGEGLMALFKFEREITEEQNKLLQIVAELSQMSMAEWVWEAIELSIDADLQGAESSPLAQKWFPEVKEEKKA